ncbi:MAG TPA: S41 family peptidase [Candidatus Krumholzibacterium sp.]|nr:S41 family peptidase [Candidatus Krumholzibacterium sp.]
MSYGNRDETRLEKETLRQSLSLEQRRLNAESLELIWNTINDTWYDPGFNGVDWEKAKVDYSSRLDSATTMNEARRVMSGMIDLLGVTHMAVIPEYYYGDEDRKDSPGFAMTGIFLRILDRHAVVTSVIKDSPADLAGVRPGWEVVRIDSVMAADQIERFTGYARLAFREDMILSWSVMELMMGRSGTVVQVEFEDGSGRTVVRDITLEQEAGKSFKFGHVPEFRIRFESEVLPGGIGYIGFNCFADPPFLMGRFNEAVTSMLDSNGIIIDLRGNPGGVGGIAMGMAGWFTREKGLSLGRLMTRDTNLEMMINPRHNAFEGPVAILVDGLSGSASEFLAGGMQGLGMAKVFGTRTAGAALPSNMIMLPNGDRLQVVTANFISSNGEPIEARGVIPDRQVLLTRERLLEGGDEVLEAAVEWIGSQVRTGMRMEMNGYSNREE